MKTGAVIIASGHKRTGDLFQPMLPVGDSTAIRRSIIQMKQAGIEPIVVVTGREGDALEKHIADLQVVCLRNTDYERTQMFFSVCMGLSYLMPLCGRIFVLPAKFPLFLKDTLESMMAEEGDLICPVYRGRRGHPILLSSAVLREILAYQGERGLQGAVRFLEGKWGVKEVPVEDQGISLAVEDEGDSSHPVVSASRISMYPEIQLRLRRNEGFFDSYLAQFLRLTDYTGSMQTACRQLHLSYTKGWRLLKEAERQLGFPLLYSRSGGEQGGFSRLTPEAVSFLDRYLLMEQELKKEGERLFRQFFGEPEDQEGGQQEE